MGDPFSSVIFGSISSGLNLASFVADIRNAPLDVKTCLDMVSRAEQDRQYLVSLRDRHLKLLTERPIELRRLDDIIKSANESIFDVARLLESCRKEANGGKVPVLAQLRWVLGDSKAIQRRTSNLQQQHLSINTEISYLRTLDSLQPLKQLTSNITYENMDMLALRRPRSSSRLSTLPTQSNATMRSSCLNHSSQSLPLYSPPIETNQRRPLPQSPPASEKTFNPYVVELSSNPAQSPVENSISPPLVTVERADYPNESYELYSEPSYSAVDLSTTIQRPHMQNRHTISGPVFELSSDSHDNYRSPTTPLPPAAPFQFSAQTGPTITSEGNEDVIHYPAVRRNVSRDFDGDTVYELSSVTGGGYSDYQTYRAPTLSVVGQNAGTCQAYQAPFPSFAEGLEVSGQALSHYDDDNVSDEDPEDAYFRNMRKRQQQLERRRQGSERRLSAK